MERGSTEAIDSAHLERVCSLALEHVGVPPSDASLTARLLVQSQAEGASSHGVLRLPMLLRRIRAGSVSKITPMTVLKDTPTTAVLDAEDGIGQVAGMRGMEVAVDKASSLGLGAVTVVNGGNFGRAGHPALVAAERDMIGIVASNASPRVVPDVNMKPVLGNNPWAVAIPTGGMPVVVDMANSIVAAGKIRAAKLEGQPIPEGWATDSSGQSTTDAGAALKGALLAFGGYKGWALSLIVDMLTGVLAGGAYGDQVGPPDDLERPQKSAFLLLAINIENFSSVEDFKGRSQDLIYRLKESSRDDVRIPGESSGTKRQIAASEGLRLGAGAVKALDEAFREIGLSGWDDLLASSGAAATRPLGT